MLINPLINLTRRLRLSFAKRVPLTSAPRRPPPARPKINSIQKFEVSLGWGKASEKARLRIGTEAVSLAACLRMDTAFCVASAVCRYFTLARIWEIGRHSERSPDELSGWRQLKDEKLEED